MDRRVLKTKYDRDHVYIIYYMINNYNLCYHETGRPQYCISQNVRQMAPVKKYSIEKIYNIIIIIVIQDKSFTIKLVLFHVFFFLNLIFL